MMLDRGVKASVTKNLDGDYRRLFENLGFSDVGPSDMEVEPNKDGSMTIRKNLFKLNKFFQPANIIIGKEEEIKFK